MSYQNKSFARIIASYKAQHFPYIKSKHWKQRLQKLSWDLAEVAGKFWNLDIEPEEHYVYVILDPRYPGLWTYTLPSGRIVKFPYRPFYVGKGKGERDKVHTKSYSRVKKSHKNSTMRAIEKAGFNPGKYVYRSKDTIGVSDWKAQAYEIDLIAGIGRADFKVGPLTNLTDGGEGAAGVIHSACAREKNRQAHIGRHHTKETKAKMRRAKLGRTHSLETKQRIGQKSLGRKHSRETKNKMSLALSKPIMANGKKFQSLTKAALSLGLSPAAVYKRLGSDNYPTFYRVSTQD